jgi:hypothetical protein
MKLLVKAYGKKNIAELTPKKIFISDPKKGRSFWMTTYVKTDSFEKRPNRKYTNQLLQSIKNEDVRGIMEAIENGAEINAQDKKQLGLTALHYAVYTSNKDLINFLLDHHPNLNIRDKFGRTPLFIAVMNKDFDTVSRLIRKGADPNIRDKDGWTPLKAASYAGDARMVEYLLHTGSDIDIKDNYGMTVDEVTWNNEEVNQILKEARKEKGELIPANKVRELRNILDKAKPDANIFVENIDGTPLSIGKFQYSEKTNALRLYASTDPEASKNKVADLKRYIENNDLEGNPSINIIATNYQTLPVDKIKIDKRGSITFLRGGYK